MIESFVIESVCDFMIGQNCITLQLSVYAIKIT